MGTLPRWTSDILQQNRYTIQSIGISDTEVQQISSSTTLTITRISGANVLPLVSTLLISSITDSLNGTELTCIDLWSSNSSSTTIHVISEESEVTQGSLVLLILKIRLLL